MSKELTDDFILNWLTDEPVAHLCVDNQAYYASKTFHNDPYYTLRKTQNAFAEKLVNFTHKYRYNFRTVHVQSALNVDQVELLREEGYRVDRVNYDKTELRAEKTAETSGNDWVDFINPHYETDLIYLKSGATFDGDGGERLKNVLFKQNCKKLLITGAFAEYCVRQAVVGAREKGFDIMIDPMLVWSKHKGPTDRIEAADLYDGRAHVTRSNQVSRVLNDNRLMP